MAYLLEALLYPSVSQTQHSMTIVPTSPHMNISDIKAMHWNQSKPVLQNNQGATVLFL